jgi:CRISPR-associated protein Cst2
MVTIVTPANGSYRLSTVNAISGDMFKHIQAEHFYHLAKGNLPLCGGCQKFRSDRALADDNIRSKVLERRTIKVGGKNRRVPVLSDEQVIDLLLTSCALDDIEGILFAPQREQGQAVVAEEGEEAGERAPVAGRSIPRKSVVEFGWVVGLPDFTDTQSYFHVRYAAERGGEEAVEQPIFHRPASSGVYAIVAHLELARIGFNDITQQYVLDDEERARRHRTLLESVLYTFVEPNGAMRSTQNPHIVDFQGAITTSSDVAPAPALSPIRDDYLGELKRLAEALNSLRPDAICVQPFDSMSAFAAVMRQIIADTAPYRLAF